MNRDGYEGRMTTCAAPRRREVCDGEPWPALCSVWSCLYYCNADNDEWAPFGPVCADRAVRILEGE